MEVISAVVRQYGRVFGYISRGSRLHFFFAVFSSIPISSSNKITCPKIKHPPKKSV
jgi:hypothetical protein